MAVMTPEAAMDLDQNKPVDPTPASAVSDSMQLEENTTMEFDMNG